jgi:hypothetical protein
VGNGGSLGTVGKTKQGATLSEEPAEPERPRKRPLWVRIFKSHDFARDLAVTTLGVLIALGIGEVVEEIRWKFRVASAESAMENELRLVNAIYHEQLALQPCVTRRLSEISEVLAHARRTGRMPDVDNVSFTPDHGSAGDSWTIMLGTEIPLHMKQDQVLGIATLWVNEDAYAANVSSARVGFHELQLMEHRPGPVSDNVLTSLEISLVKVKAAVFDAWMVANRESERLAAMDIHPSYGANAPWNEKEMTKTVRQRFICKPLMVDGHPYRLKGPPIHFARGMLNQPEPS